MDDVLASALPPATQTQLLPRRRYSSSKPVFLPIDLSLHHHSASTSSATSSSSSSSPSSSSVVDLDLISIKSNLISIKPISYTSFKDLLPSTAVSSPKPNSPSQSSSEEISIKNRLVKQAAWAYLQPMSTTPDSSGRNFLHRIWIKILGSTPVAAFRSFFDHHIFRRLYHAFDWLLRAVRIRSSR